VIPFLLELRALMDWMFTDTTLALTSWLQMEDIFASVFCIKCDRNVERVCYIASLDLFLVLISLVVVGLLTLVHSGFFCTGVLHYSNGAQSPAR